MTAARISATGANRGAPSTEPECCGSWRPGKLRGHCGYCGFPELAHPTGPSHEPDSWSIVIPGRAVPKERPRSNGGTWYTPERTKNWEERVGWAWKEAHGQTLLQGPLVGELAFVGKCRGDLDNLAKGVFDALNGIAYGDDSQVEEMHLYRLRTKKVEHTTVTIRRKGATG